MRAIALTPSKGLKRAYLNRDIGEKDFNRFSAALDSFISNLQNANIQNESEEHIKNTASEFLQAAFYRGTRYINTYRRTDLVIHTGKDATAKIGAVCEFKRETNKNQMIRPDNFNTKALHEVIRYLFEEIDRSSVDALEIRRVIVSDGWQWFIFDSKDFLRLFIKDVNLKREYKKWSGGQKTDASTQCFYEITAKRIDELDEEIRAVYFDCPDAIGKGVACKKIKKQIYKCLAPEYLLKEEEVNDSNVLNRDFYNELLYIIGLEENKESGNILIGRMKEPQRGSLIENTIRMLDSDNCLDNLGDELKGYGVTKENQLFNVALELCLTWVNRVLFLKLLEAQLIHYHNGNVADYAFLSTSKIKDFDELNRLFFQVLAKKPSERDSDLPEHWKVVPYLNSSLFEVSKLEKKTEKISNLSNAIILPVYKRSVLQDDKKKRLACELPTLEYLLRFLGAWSFGKKTEGGISKDGKTIINASVLGLIFEKINGYKDGSFFTPGFITEYMANTAVEQVVVEKFNTEYKWSCETLIDLENKIQHIDIIEANSTINSLRICDPAVGSGHFLVSVLNALIAIKSQLGILVDPENRSLRYYSVRVENDELVVTDKESGVPLNYHLRPVDNQPNPDLQTVQETLFHQKRTIIENCLFGVDINPNSVNICRLRLWIELLKNAYYTKESFYTQLETLPNIDIKIKCGDSLISRFDLHGLNNISPGSRKEYLKLVASYKQKIWFYKRCPNLKSAVLAEIEKLKTQFENFAVPSDKDYMVYLAAKRQQVQMFLPGSELIKDVATTISKDFIEASKRWEEKQKQLFGQAFEWRFEFPEVLDEDGEFMGFDLVIGNPPYGVSLTGDYRAQIVSKLGKVPDYEIYYYFIERANALVKDLGILSYIIPNTYLFNTFADKYRLSILQEWKLLEILDCSRFPLFESASIYNTVNMWQKATHDFIGYRNTSDADNFAKLIAGDRIQANIAQLIAMNQNWGLVFRLDTATMNIISKIRERTKPLSSYFSEVSQGLIAYDKYQGQNKEFIRSRPYHHFTYKDGLKRWLWGEDVIRYSVQWNGREYIDYCKGIANPRKPKYFQGKRMLIREITNPFIYASITEEELYNDPSIIVVLDSSSYSLEVVTGILNSKLGAFYHFNHSPKATKGGFPKILVKDVNEFPLPDINLSMKEEIEKKVKFIVATKNADPKINTSVLEGEIDTLIYELFGLTEEEIAVVDEALRKKIKNVD